MAIGIGVRAISLVLGNTDRPFACFRSIQRCSGTTIGVHVCTQLIDHVLQLVRVARPGNKAAHGTTGIALFKDHACCTP